MNDLVSEAGISSGAFYRYFASKDAVIAAIAAENLDEIDELFRTAVAKSETAFDVMATVLETVAQRHADDGFAEIALQVWSRSSRSPDIAKRLAATMRAATDALEAAEDMRRERGHGSDARQLASLLACVLPGYVLGIATMGAASMADVPATLRHSLSPSHRDVR